MVNWFSELSVELEVKSEHLIMELIDYREECRSRFLRESYPGPAGIKGFPDTKTCNAKSVDFLLTFLNDKYPDYKTNFAEQAKDQMLNGIPSYRLAITRNLRLEDYRRKAYWEKKLQAIDIVLLGWHLCCRRRLEGEDVVEAFYISKNAHFPQLRDAFWLRSTITGRTVYFGEFCLSQASLFGTFITHSTDKIVRPVHITIGYADVPGQTLKNFSVGGITGVERESGEVFHSQFQIFCHMGENELKMKAETFHEKAMRLVSSPAAKAALEAFSNVEVGSLRTPPNLFKEI